MEPNDIKRSASWPITLLAVLTLVAASGCSIKQFAVNRVGDALAGGGETFGSDDDPDFIRDAAPFSLKMMESLLAESPRHRGLLLASCKGFTQYAYGFIQQKADEKESSDLETAKEMRVRARRMYLRARDYGLRGLEVSHRYFERSLRADPKTAVRSAQRGDVPLLYWTAAAWGAAISLSKDNPELVADQPIVEALIDRALELDEAFDSGALHSFMINYEMARPGLSSKEAMSRALKHFDRAVRLSGGQLASPFVSYAEQVAVAQQKRAEFVSLLERALAVNPDARKEWRLENVIMQRRARWLLKRVDELFAE